MRPIKFRLYIGGKFFYWGFLDGNFTGLPDTNMESLTMDEKQERSKQFTGLHDAHGKEIYEGDIIQEYGSDPDEVIFEDGAFVTETCNEAIGMLDLQEIEVVGNIYENPRVN